ncbi:MAG: glutathione transferase [Arcobacter sp.]|nr:MAG: glutathione transferase [Arcobacter sp.]
MLQGLNHITLAVSNLDKSFDFYVNILGFKAHAKWKEGAYLSIGDLWFCLNTDEVDFRGDYSHIAFDIKDEDYDKYVTFLLEKKVHLWKENSSEGKSLYLLDPDLHKIEIHVGSLQSRLKSLKEEDFENLEYFI